MSISPGSMIVTIIAILAGLVGAYAVRASLMQEPAPVAEPPTVVTVPLASTELPAGRAIKLGDITLMPMTHAEMKERNLPLELVMLAPGQIIGRTLLQDIERGKPFLTTEMYLDGSRPDVSKLLKPGYRAVHLQIPDVRGGTVPPGSVVDVLFRAAARKAQAGQPAIRETTITLIEGAAVLAVDRPKPISSDPSVLDVRYRNAVGALPPTMILAVTPEQATMLQAVGGRGELSLIARPESETLVAGSHLEEGLTLEGLLGVTDPPKPFATEIYRRGERQLMVFDTKTLADVPATVASRVSTVSQSKGSQSKGAAKHDVATVGQDATP